MKITQLYRQKDTVVSFEVFPPKQDVGESAIYDTIDALRDIKPDFISVTYSAGGVGVSDKTLAISSAVQNGCGITALSHLTCVNADRGDISAYLDKLKAENISNVLALRGDIPQGAAIRSDYTYASDLIRDIKRQSDICVGAAAYPEGHIDCESLDVSVDHMKEKMDCGAEFFISQLFFDNNLFLGFMEKVRARGIKAPVSAGIMPMMTRSQIEKMIFMCGASLPSRMIKLLHKYADDPASLLCAGADYAAEQVADLIANGADGIHVYTMNRPEIAKAIIFRRNYED